MFPTPDLSHLTKSDYLSVYEPAEDTFLLLDALEQEADILRRDKPTLCLEIGSGSGCVSTFLAQLLGKSPAAYICTDINPHAALCTKRTGAQNKATLEPILASLADPIHQRLHHAVDVLVFNPPYVPTDAEEARAAQAAGGIQGSWAGGSDGMEVTSVLLNQVEGLLSPKGRFYLVALKQNNIPVICERMHKSFNLQSHIVIQRRAGREQLFIVCFTRTADLGKQLADRMGVVASI